MANKYYIGCLHLGHESMSVKRGFENSEKMFQYMKNKWNKRVNKKDVIYILGDITMEKKKFYPLLNELKGRKVFVLGNHDRRQDTEELMKYGQVVGMVKYKDIFITHCPIHPMELDYRVKHNIHSHLHEKSVLKKFLGLFTVKDKRYTCVSCEHVDYTPKSLEELGFL